MQSQVTYTLLLWYLMGEKRQEKGSLWKTENFISTRDQDLQQRFIWSGEIKFKLGIYLVFHANQVVRVHTINYQK